MEQDHLSKNHLQNRSEKRQPDHAQPTHIHTEEKQIIISETDLNLS